MNKVTIQLHKKTRRATKKASGKKETGTRERLLKVAMRQFAEHGFAGAKVDKIVAAARVNKRMVYHYFGSKEDLYCAVLERAYERLEALDAALFPLEADPATAIREIVRNYFRFLRENPDLVKLLLWENLQKGKYIARLSLSQPRQVIKSPMLAYLEKITRAGIASGAFRSDLEVKHLLINLIGLCLVYFSNRYTLSRTVDLPLGESAVLEEAAKQAGELAVRGIAA